jgi:hypothetical protein
MGLFGRSKKTAPPSSIDPIVTYHISQNLSGKLTVTSATPKAYAYSITLAKKKAWHDTIEVAIHRSVHSTYQQQGDVVGHCLIRTTQGKFVGCRFDAYGQDIKLDRLGRRGTDTTSYDLEVPSLGKFRWTHDEQSVTRSSRRLKLVENASGAILARFGGAESGVSEFGVLEVYDPRVAYDQDWCGLCILTAVCVFAREERYRERRTKMNGVVGNVSNWGGLLTMFAGA